MAKFKRVRTAFNDGFNGEPVTEGQTTPVRHRAVRKLGGMAAKYLGRDMQTMQAANEALDAHQIDRFKRVSAQSVGHNKQALKIVEAMDRLPNTLSSKPMWGIGMRSVDGSAGVHLWNVSLGAGEDRGSTIPKDPIMRLGSIFLDNLDGMHSPAGVRLPVDNVIITCTAPIDNSGGVGPASTRITINTRPYDPESVARSTSGDFNGGLLIDIDPEGNVSGIQSQRGGSTGYKTEDPQSVKLGLEDFLNGVRFGVDETAQAYAELGRM